MGLALTIKEANVYACVSNLVGQPSSNDWVCVGRIREVSTIADHFTQVTIRESAMT
jgi:hypothetical protein